jgi:hypothetical protein
MTAMDRNAAGPEQPAGGEADSWETVALRRVARHVEELPDVPAEAEDFGWEEGILERLRQRLAANE